MKKGHKKGFFKTYPVIVTVSLVIIVGGIAAYNLFLLDRATVTLESALGQVTDFKNKEDLHLLRYQLDDLVSEELMQKDINVRRLGNLQFSQSITSTVQDARQLQDVQTLLQDSLESRAKRPPTFRQYLYRLILNLRARLGMVAGQDGKVSYASGRDLTIEETQSLEDARLKEKSWKLEEAEKLYEQLAAQTSDAKEATRIAFDWAYVNMKLASYGKADKVLNEVRQKYLGYKEEQTALVLLERMEALQKWGRKADELERSLPELAGEERKTTLIELGRLNYKTFRMEKAAEVFAEASEASPMDEVSIKAMIFQGMALKASAQYEESIRVFREIKARYPDSEYAKLADYEIADNYRSMGSFEEAVDSFGDAADAFAGSEMAALAQFQAGYSLMFDLGQPIAAAAQFKKLADSAPQSDGLQNYAGEQLSPYVRSKLLNYAFLMLRRGELDKAESAFKVAIAEVPKDPWGHSGFGLTYGAQGKTELALKEGRLGLSLTKDAFTHSALGFILDQAGQAEAAMVQYMDSLKLRNTYWYPHYNLARLFEKLNQQELAEQHYQQAIDAYDDAYLFSFMDEVLSVRNEEKGLLYLDLARVKRHLNRTAPEILELYREAVKLMPESDVSHFRLGVAYENDGRPDLARTEFRTALEINPSMQEAKMKI